MSGRTPYIAASWKAGVELGRPTLIGVRRKPPWPRSRARNGTRPLAIASSSTARDRPSIWTIKRRRRAARSTRRWRPRTRSSRGMDTFIVVGNSSAYTIRDYAELEGMESAHFGLVGDEKVHRKWIAPGHPLAGAAGDGPTL